MTTKKKKENKTTNKVTTKKTIPVAKPAKVVPIVQNKDVLLSIEQIAEILNMSSFEFYIVKEKFNIEDGALFTISEFREMYKKAIRR